MGLSSDLISQFAKVVNDDKTTKKETTLRGTTVVVGDVTYVKLDGSDILTPVTTTADVKNDERVTVMIKDHSATVTGNSSSPAARTGDVQEIGNQISEFEIVIADKVSTKQLEAQVGRIDDLVSENVTIKNRLTAGEASIGELEADNVTINEKLVANDAEIKTLQAEKIDADFLVGKYATVENLEATNADIHNLQADYGEFETLVTGDLAAINGHIDSLEANKLSAVDADIKYATIASLDAEIARIDDLDADVASIDTLIFGSASGEVIQTSFANAVIAQLGNAQIKSAMIENISADKITAGDIITNNVRVMSEDGSLIISDETIQISDGTRVRVQIGKDASNDYSINIWDASGNLMFSEGGITDSAIKDAIIRNDMVSEDANISASKLDISSLFTEINGSTETINSTKIYLDDKAQTLDVAFTSLSSDVDDMSNTVSSQGTQISTIQGQITSKIWQQDIDEATGELSTQYSTLEQEVDGISATVASHTTEIAKKADSSAVTTVSDRVTSVEASLDGFKSTVSETYATKTEVTTAINDIEIGGRNLIPKSAIQSHSYYKEYENTLSGFGVELPASSDTVVFASSDIFSKFTLGETYVVSFKAIAEGETQVLFDFYPDTFTGAFGNARVTVTTEVNTYSYAGVLENSDSPTSMQLRFFRLAYDPNYKIDVYDIKVEKGNKPTDWTPAPEDISDRISLAETSITQNSEQISLRATKTEVTAAINEIEIGSRNLWANGDFSRGRMVDGTTFIGDPEVVDLEEGNPTGFSQALHTTTMKDKIRIDRFLNPTEELVGKTLTLSLWVKYENVTAGENYYNVLNIGKSSATYTLEDGTTTSFWPIIVGTSNGFSGTSDWVRLTGSYTFRSDVASVTLNRLWIGLESASTGEVWVTGIKLEYGNKATDWTPAPEDMATTVEVENAQTAANDAKAAADATEARVTVSESEIKQISDSIAMLITDENGQSAMTQTSDGWTFNISSINNQLDDTASALNELSGRSDVADKAIENLKDIAADLGEKTAYINMTTDDSGNPRIELGKSDNDFKVRITNTAVEFLEGSDKIAYVSNKTLYIERAIIKNELQIGEGTGFVWRKRKNNNMGLRWIGG